MLSALEKANQELEMNPEFKEGLSIDDVDEAIQILCMDGKCMKSSGLVAVFREYLPREDTL